MPPGAPPGSSIMPGATVTSKSSSTSRSDSWPARSYHEVVVQGDRMVLLGGQNFIVDPNPACATNPFCYPRVASRSEFFDDVWASTDGATWTPLTTDAPWEGRAGLSATLLLVITYVLIGTALVAYAGLDAFAAADRQGIESEIFDDLATPILGSPLDKLVLIAVLTSALASTQTTILPGARTTLSMAFHNAFPERFGEVSPRFFTPAFSTIVIAILAIAWYVPLNLFAQGSLFDSLQALSLLIAFYYAINGLSCFAFYRNEILRPGIWVPAAIALIAAAGLALAVGGIGDYYDLGGLFNTLVWIGAGLAVLLLVTVLAGAKKLKSALFIGVAPLTGAFMLGFVLIRSVLDLANPDTSSSGEVWLGVTPALVMGVGFMAVGVVAMFLWRAFGSRPFFARKLETVTSEALAKAPVAK